MTNESLRNITKLIFDQPALYHGLRTFFLGGLPWPELLRLLDSNKNDVIVDIGAGTGTIAEKIHFRKYIGFDHDPRSIRVALKKNIPNASFLLQDVNEMNLTALKPTKAVLSGILHHLTDQQALSLLNSLARSISQCVVTLDPIFWKGHILNNFLCRLDRGHYIRTKEQMLNLINESSMQIDAEAYYSSNTKITKYASYRLIPRKRS